MYLHQTQTVKYSFTCIYNTHPLHIQDTECLALKRNTSGEWDRCVGKHCVRSDINVPPKSQQVLNEHTVQ